MKQNMVWAMVLSFLLIFGWNALVTKKGQNTQGAAPASAVEPSGEPVPPIVHDRLLEFEIGRHHLTVNHRGGAVAQWVIKEPNGDPEGIPFVHDTQNMPEPLATFSDLFFDIARSTDSITFSALRPDGLSVTKQLHLSPEGFRHDVTLSLVNTSTRSIAVDTSLGWSPGLFSGDREPKTDLQSQRALAFSPPRLLTTHKPTRWEGTLSWWALDARYFIVAFLPPTPEKVILDITAPGTPQKWLHVAYLIQPTLAPGEHYSVTLPFYLGPKDTALLSSFGVKLERAVDYGLFKELGMGVHWSLQRLHRLTGNYGWAIILLTFGIQILLFPLTFKSFQYGQRMKTLQPKMTKLREQFKNDPKRLNTEMLHLYQQHGLKLMGLEGCLPVLIQLPVFWALYNALRNSYELRYAPWLGWITDLSFHDPYYILPVLMGVAMFLQQRITAPSMDPSQAKIMYIFPVMMTFVFLKMPSGLVLYWLTSSLLSFASQTFLLKRSQPARVA